VHGRGEKLSDELIQVPDFKFSTFYYADILRALINYRRSNVPEITDENPLEPYIQLERAFALVAHQNNVLLDFIAKETLLPTAQLRQSVASHLKMIDYELSEASPAVTEIVMKLTKLFTSSFQILPILSRVATEYSEEQPAIAFEDLLGLNIERTDQVSKVFALEDTTYTDYTTEANTDASYFSPWATPAAGDKLYVGHEGIMWDKLNVIFQTGGSGLTGIWEYYDGEWSDVNPSRVKIDGDKLVVDLTSLLGANDRSGAVVRLILISTSAYEEMTSQWGDPGIAEWGAGDINYAETTGFLGQTSPSEEANQYVVGSQWHSLEETDGTANLSQDGDVDYDLPQTLTKRWARGEINAYEAYWMRYRIISVSSPAGPSIDRLKVDTGNQHIMHSFTQGLTVEDDPLGTSNGQANQSFTFTQGPLIGGSQKVYVDDGLWTEVRNFLNSGPGDGHYILSVDDDGIATATFSDGVSGRIPPSGNTIRSEYRINAEEDGNVGAGTIGVNKSGISFVTDIVNPRQAIGWTAKEGSTPALLEIAKLEGPASVRTLERAVGPSDVRDLAVAYTTEEGSKLVSRARAVEEAYGAKTVLCVVVGTGGATLSEAQQTELEEYFNGNLLTGKDGVLVLNQRVYVDNYTPKIIDVTATVYGGKKDLIETALKVLLDPEARTADGLRWEWDFGETVPTSRIIAQIFIVAGVRQVELTAPAANVVLTVNELPKVGTLSITVNP